MKIFFSKDAVDDDLVLHENDICLTKVVCVLCDSDELLLTSFFFVFFACLFVYLSLRACVGSTLLFCLAGDG